MNQELTFNKPRFRFFVLTLFPEQINNFLNYSIVSRASKQNIIEINCINIRDFSQNRYNQVDDRLYGGGRGMLLKADVISSAIESLANFSCDIANTKKIYMSPRGRKLDQRLVKTYASDFNELIILCGHYEGVDQRVLDYYDFEEITIGDYVLTGGELASIVCIDSISRLIQGVLPDNSAFENESHYNDLLEENQFTMPSLWNGRSVPKVLLSGDHKRIENFRRLSSMKVTLEKRPDLFDAYDFTFEDYKNLADFILSN